MEVFWERSIAEGCGVLEEAANALSGQTGSILCIMICLAQHRSSLPRGSGPRFTDWTAVRAMGDVGQRGGGGARLARTQVLASGQIQR